MKWLISAERQIWSDQIAIRIGFVEDDGRRMVARSPSFTPLNDGAYIEPMMSMDVEAAQKLMEELWSAGIRPAAAAGSMGQLSAVQYHLEDMRSLVFKELK